VIIGVLQVNQLLAKGSRLGELHSVFPCRFIKLHE